MNIPQSGIVCDFDYFSILRSGSDMWTLLVIASIDDLERRMSGEQLAPTSKSKSLLRIRQKHKSLPISAAACQWRIRHRKHRRHPKRSQSHRLACQDNVCSFSDFHCPRCNSNFRWRMRFQTLDSFVRKRRSCQLWRRCYQYAPAAYRTVQRFQWKLSVLRLLFWHSQLSNRFLLQVKVSAFQRFSSIRRDLARWT